MSTTDKLESLYLEMEEHQLVEDLERSVVSESTEGIDEVHITVQYENLEKVESEIKTNYTELGVLFDEELETEDDTYKIVVGYAGRI